MCGLVAFAALLLGDYIGSRYNPSGIRLSVSRQVTTGASSCMLHIEAEPYTRVLYDGQDIIIVKGDDIAFPLAECK